MDEFNNYKWHRDDFEKDAVNKQPTIFNNTQSYYTENYSQKKKKKKKLSLNYITVAIISAVIGGMIFGSTFAFLSPMLNNTLSSAPNSAVLADKDNDAQNNEQTDENNESTNNNANENNSDNQEKNVDSVTPATPKIVANESGNIELSVMDIAKKVGPAVVGIINRVQTQGFIRETVEQGSGSGIIMSPDGYIITNNHVIEGATEVTVILNTGKKYEARLIGKDAKTDLAVIKIDAEDLHYAQLGDSSKLQVGELAVAIGNPLGQEFAGSVTTGVISALNRTIKVEDKTMTLIQTDAAINPGNSGGALVNSYGKVIGINTIKMSATGVEGIGFAIPANEAKPIIEELIQHGYVTGRPLIGISGRNVTEDIAKMYDLPVGVYVDQVAQNSGAGKAGIQPGDVIVKFNGKTIKTMDELNQEKENFKAGDIVEIEVRRDMKAMTFEVELIEEKN
ncbi:trypsin-like peptidase domain-containing protein [Petroclostridium sp. X23]|uniref:S1C family serine protease n=1 Tax=Petroclostridium sp. X23 TaxID=3045146 RepID=UPI0024ACD571|nr:trypsin-like peptidase domain-containing protein [Petroclostridium sp. X23]WHH59593.1 trypsin-like peptidase domain-containing protein [Petroclostridium sp. X23]